MVGMDGRHPQLSIMMVIEEIGFPQIEELFGFCHFMQIGAADIKAAGVTMQNQVSSQSPSIVRKYTLLVDAMQVLVNHANAF